MISCTKLRVIQQGVIFYDNSHLRETMVEWKLISTTDKLGANRPRKDDKYNQVSMNTAEMIQAPLGILGAKLA